MSERWGREFRLSGTRVGRTAMGNRLGIRMNSTGRGEDERNVGGKPGGEAGGFDRAVMGKIGGIGVNPTR